MSNQSSTTLDYLKKFLKEITSQDIILTKINFDTFKENVFLFYTLKEKPQLDREWNINEIRVEIGNLILNNNSKVPIITINYVVNYKDFFIHNKSKKLITSIRLIYTIRIILKENSFFETLSESEQKNIIDNFADSTGKLIIIPYIRHIIDFLSRLAGTPVLPLPPVMIKDK